MKSLLSTAAVLALALASTPVHADEYSWSPQLQQDGISQSLQASANYGKGLTIAIVDTGIDATHNEFAGRISSQSTCVATGNCAGGYNDTYGHGTFVSSIAAGALNNYGMVGVAPNATLMAVKIAQPNASANFTDLVNGVSTAANRGAQVINLSFGSFFGPSATPSYAYWNGQLVNAINTAAAKGATVVLAAGNSAQTFVGNVDITGFTAAALSHLVIVGSVNSANQLSSWSNTPGTSNLVNTANQKTALDKLWVMTPGENLIGAYNTGNYDYVYWSGTSFSAPQVSGALALLDARWPVLLRNGTTTSVLFTTTTDLGAAGVDTTYGNGLMNLNKAFQPVGALVIPNAKGQNVQVSQITGTMLTSGAFGSLSSLQSKLSNMTAFDTYQRDFSVNLSGLVSTAKKPSSVAASVTAPKTTGGKIAFDNGASMAFGEATSTASTVPQPDGAPAAQKSFYMSMTDSDGATLAGGYGFPASASFAEALWGSDTAAADNVGTLGVSNGLMDLAEGGAFAAYGAKLSDKTRFAFSYTQTQDNQSLESVPSATAHANAFGAGVTTKMTEAWTAGVTFNTLNEDNGLLGSTYSGGALGFGAHHNSVSVGISSAFDLGNNMNLMLDAAMMRSDSANMTDGIVTHVSDIYSRSLGATVTQRDAFKDGDRLSVYARKPMQVLSGSASIATNSVDSNGYATTGSENVSLRPDGSETDIGVTYAAPWKYGVNMTASFEGRHDAENISGNNSADVLVGAKFSF